MGEKIMRWLRDRRAQLVGTLPVIVFFIALFWIVQLGFGDQYLLAVSPFTTLFETRLDKYNQPGQYARFFLVSALALVQAFVFYFRYRGELANGFVVALFMLLLLDCLLTWFAHRKNIVALLAGEEHHTSVKKLSHGKKESA